MSLRIDNAGKLVLSEADVQRQCIDWLAAEGWRWVRTGFGKVIRDGKTKEVYGEPGMPDIQAIYYTQIPMAAQVVWIEFKKPAAPGIKKGCLSPTQARWIATERKRGATVLVIDSLEQLQKELSA